MGIRPVHVSFAEGAGAHTIAARVDVSEMMGSEIHLHVTAKEDNGAEKDVVLVVSTTDLPESVRAGIPYGTTIHFTFPGELVHLFDKETERNLLAD